MKQQTLLDFALNDQADQAVIGNQLLTKVQIKKEFNNGNQSPGSHKTTQIFNLIPNLSPGAQSPKKKQLYDQLKMPQYTFTPLQQSNSQQNLHDYSSSNRELIYQIEAFNYDNDPRTVPLSLFINIIQQLEQRLAEFEIRLENKEKLEHINDNYNQLRRNQAELEFINLSQNLDQLPDEDGDNPSRRVSRFQSQKTNPKNSCPPLKKTETSESYIQRLNIFEKKVRLLEENIQKNQKEDQTFKKNIEKRLEEQLKDVDNWLQKFAKQAKDIVLKIDDVGKNQNQFQFQINNIIHDLQSNAPMWNVKIQDIEEKQTILEDALTLISDVTKNVNEETSELKIRVGSLEEETLKILGNFGDCFTLTQQISEIKINIKNIESQLIC